MAFQRDSWTRPVDDKAEVINPFRSAMLAIHDTMNRAQTQLFEIPIIDLPDFSQCIYERLGLQKNKHLRRVSHQVHDGNRDGQNDGSGRSQKSLF